MKIFALTFKFIYMNSNYANDGIAEIHKEKREKFLINLFTDHPDNRVTLYASLLYEFLDPNKKFKESQEVKNRIISEFGSEYLI